MIPGIEGDMVVAKALKQERFAMYEEAFAASKVANEVDAPTVELLVPLDDLFRGVLLFARHDGVCARELVLIGGL